MKSNTISKKDLYDKSAATYVLSTLMRKPLLLQDDKYSFTKTDFDSPLHQMIFFAIFNMAQQGASVIIPSEIDLYIKQYDTQYAYYKQNNGYDYILECYNTTEGSDGSQFDIYYNKLKKFSVLRDLESIGIDTTEFYNPNADPINLDVEERKLNDISLSTIAARIKDKISIIENRHIGKDEGTSQTIGKNLRNIVSSYRECPEVGVPLDGSIMNYATRGARLGKMYIYSAPSGAGKTRTMVGNACSISLPYIDNNGEVVYRGTADEPSYEKVLFVATEMSADEIQTLVLAYVSGVNEKKILLGNPTPDEAVRIDRALDIIEKYEDNFVVECIPDPSIAMLRARLTKYIIQDNIDYIFYDYIFNSPGLVGEFSSSGLREDVVLMMLANSLKELAMTYNVFIFSATQLNEGWAKKEIGSRDQNCIRGSKAIPDKVDVGLIGVRLNEEEYKQIDAIWMELKKSHPEWMAIDRPSLVVDLYKNRRGDINFVKIFRYFDYGTCRCIDLFITDTVYKGVEVGKLNYEVNKYDFMDLRLKGGEES